MGPILNNGKEFQCGWLFDEEGWEFNCLLEKFNDLFVSGELTEFTVSHQDGFPINTKENPIFIPSRLSEYDKNRLIPKINELLKSGYLERSNSQWSSPARPEFTNGKLEIFVNYRRVNEITEKYRDRLSSIPEVLYSISQSSVFSKIALKDVFHQLGLENTSKEMTAFAIEGIGRFQFKTFHKGLKNAFHALKRTTDNLLRNLDQGRIKVYRGQILVHTGDNEEHLDMLSDLFQELHNFNLKVDVDDSKFFQSQLIYLGKTVSKSGIGIHPDQLSKIKSFEAPRSIPEVSSFLGLVNQYKDHVNSVYFDQLTQPLYDLKYSNCGFYWDNCEDDAFTNLKNLIASAGPIPLQQQKQQQYYM